MKFLAVGSFLLVCGWATASPLHHHDVGHATSYAVVTKHDSSPHHGWDNKEWLPHAANIVAINDHDHDDWGQHDVHDSHAKYQFEYGVKDLHTGDIKNQWEHRDGGHVKGSYSLKEADGTTRLVHYTADDHNGFNAVVQKLGHAHHDVVQAKPLHHSSWENDYSHHGNDLAHDHSHGHATSYAKVHQH